MNGIAAKRIHHEKRIHTMIAPLQTVDSEPSQTSEEAERLARARRIVAAALLDEPSEPAPTVRPIRAIWAWLFAGWVVLCVGMYFASMLNLF